MFSSNEVIEAIETNNCFRLLAILGVDDCLDSIHEESGKTVRKLIEESGMDFSGKNRIKYAWGELELTPLESVFIICNPEDKSDIPNLGLLDVILALGADVNREIDEERDTILHRCVRDEVHPLALRRLLKGGGDLARVNRSGLTPLDLADELTKEYLLEIERNIIHSRTIKIQRMWRSKRYEHTIPSIDYSNIYVKSVPPNKEGLREWISKHEPNQIETAKRVASSIQHISFPRFIFGLKMAIEKFNKYLSSLPPSEREFIVLVDSRVLKSGPWVTRLSIPYLKYEYHAVIDTEEINTYEPPPHIHHMIILDDASYTGNLLYETQRKFYGPFLGLNRRYMNLQLHIVIPFTTQRARDRFKEFPSIIHTRELIPKFDRSGTTFIGHTATYFDHKVPSEPSTIGCIENGNLVDGRLSGIQFVERVIPPYKRKEVTTCNIN